LLAVTLLSIETPTVWAQSPRRGSESAQSTLPSDQRLLKLHRAFIIDAEKLAIEYERGKDFDKAKAVYGEILKLYPQHQLARNKLKLIREHEENADVEVITVVADEGWQDTWINVIQGKPVRIRAEGIWTLSIKLPPGGVPKELKEFNLGILIGTINTGKGNELEAFAIGKDKLLMPKRTGRLLLRMYDVLPNDNTGEIKVQIKGTFVQARR
jgi:hypothetical protein